MTQLDRRQFGGLTAAAAASWRIGAARRRRPNVLIIQTDQQSSWTLSCYGGDLVSTPHVDGLAARGYRFDQWFTNSAVCTPSRGCFLTGQYPHTHEALRNNLAVARSAPTFAKSLRDAGWNTGYAGKWHLDGQKKPGWVPSRRAMGFDDSRFMFNRGHWKTIVDREGATPQVKPYQQIGDAETYTTDWLTRKTEDFLAAQTADKPFVWMVAIPDPHTPFTVRAPYDKRFDPADMPLPSTVFEDGKPAWANGRVDQLVAKRGRDGAAAALRGWKAKYCGMVALIDDCVGRILAALERHGMADDTIVVFTTDHGEYMGEHGLMGKNRPYETAWRIPFVLTLPESHELSGARSIDHLCSHVDFLPTLASLCGVPIPGGVQGEDRTGLLRGEEPRQPNVVFGHHSSDQQFGVFTAASHLHRFQSGEGDVLFDRRNDPEERDNLIGDSERAKELTALLADHLKAVDSSGADWMLGRR